MWADVTAEVEALGKDVMAEVEAFKAGTKTAIEVEAAARTAEVEAAKDEATAAIEAEAGARAADAETFGQELASANTQLVEFKADVDDRMSRLGGDLGRGLHSSTFQLNLSRFGVLHTSPCPPV